MKFICDYCRRECNEEPKIIETPIFAWNEKHQEIQKPSYFAKKCKQCFKFSEKLKKQRKNHET